MAHQRHPVHHDLTLPDGRTLHALRYPGRGETLVLLHGLLDSCEGWRELVRNSTRPVIAFDLPGFGGSDAPLKHGITGYALDVIGALDELGLDEWVLVGHSFGGAVATAIAELRPEQTAALVLLAPAGFGRLPLAERALLPGVRQTLEVAMPASLGSKMATTIVYATMVANGHRPDPDMLARLRRDAKRVMPGALQATRTIAACGRGERAFYRRPVSYAGPVFVLWGAEDRLVPLSHIDGVKVAFPHAEVEVWENVGHHPQREAAARLSRYVEDAALAVEASHALAT